MLSRFIRAAFAVVVALLISFAPTASLKAQGRGETEKLLHGKMTKNEAQHLVLKKYPGATIKQCELKKSGERSLWEVQFTNAGESDVQIARVDDRTGKTAALAAFGFSLCTSVLGVAALSDAL
jgi:hypothetical protein